MGGYGLTYTDISDNILYSGKSYSILNGDLFNICNDTVTTVLETILDYLNDFATNAPCLVKVSVDDDVCNYLFNKLESTDNSVTIIKNSTTNTITGITTETVNLSVIPRIDIINSLASETVNVVLSAPSTGAIYNEAITQLINDGDALRVEFTIQASTFPLNYTFTVNFGGIQIDNVNIFNNSHIIYNYSFLIIRKDVGTALIKGYKKFCTVSPNYGLGSNTIVSQENLINKTLTTLDLDISNLFNVQLTTIASGSVTGTGLIITKLFK